MKVVKSAQHYTETALDEIKLLRCVSEKAIGTRLQLYLPFYFILFSLLNDTLLYVRTEIIVIKLMQPVSDNMF